MPSQLTQNFHYSIISNSNQKERFKVLLDSFEMFLLHFIVIFNLKHIVCVFSLMQWQSTTSAHGATFFFQIIFIHIVVIGWSI